MRTRSVAAVLGPAALLAPAALLLACSPGAPEPASDVGVQLFTWTWDAVAAECPHLAEVGYGWVLVSPPQEHVLGDAWWTHYQPVSYQVESRLGTREQFATMVDACADVGVEVLADAVINHMTGMDSGTGWAGSTFTHYDYPGIYTEDDFHHCPGDGDIGNYQDATEVQTCELVNLADLATETDRVRATVVGYLRDLLDLGVAGFRIDAAKHMPAADVAAIVGELPEGTRIVAEVIHGAGEPIQPEQYLDSGQVFDFAYAESLIDPFEFGAMDRLLEPAGLDPAGAVVFVANHDTERNGSTLRYRQPETFAQATAWMLAASEATPMVYSGYAFSERDAGPVLEPDGSVRDATCAAGAGTEWADGDWVCQHRWPAVEALVAWRAAVGDAPVADAWASEDAVAVGREGRGLVVLNTGPPLTEELATSLPDGTYCDLVTGGADDGACRGTSVTVSDGLAQVSLDTGGVLALLVDAQA